MRFSPLGSRRTAVLAGAFLLALTLSLSAQSPDDRYVKVYSMIEEADKLKAAGDGRAAVTRYLEAQVALQGVQQTFPEWNPKLVGYRLDYISDQIATLTEKSAPAGAKEAPGAGAPSPAVQLKVLEEEIARLTSQNALLEAKLREALKVQPAAIDPRELAKAEERIKR